MSSSEYTRPVWYETDEDHEQLFESWGRMPLWSASEAACLIHGCDPDSDFIRDLGLARDVERTQKLIEKSCECGFLPNNSEKLDPATLLSWGKKRGLSIPPVLEQQVERHPSSGPTATATDQVVAQENEKLKAKIAELQAEIARLKEDPPPNARAQKSLLKLVLGMAVARYKYNPKLLKNPATAIIKRDLDLLPSTFHMDDQPILDCLRKAASELQWPPAKVD